MFLLLDGRRGRSYFCNCVKL